MINLYIWRNRHRGLTRFFIGYAYSAPRYQVTPPTWTITHWEATKAIFALFFLYLQGALLAIFYGSKGPVSLGTWSAFSIF